MRAWPAWLPAVGLYVAALAARLPFLGTRPYGDEAHHYYIARHLGQGPDNIYRMLDNEWLFWWRPLFSLALSPGAQAGFMGFRFGYMLLVAALAPLLWWWLRGRGVSQRASVVAGLLVAFHPFIVTWGVRAFPDELMAVGFVAGLALWERGRHAAGAVAFLAAAWVKEVAIVGIAVLFAEELLTGLRRDGREVTVRLGARHAFLAVVLALAYVPHLYAEHIGGRPPGWSRGGDVAGILDGAFTTVWFVPLVVAALWLRPSRRSALLALTYLAFFAAYTAVLGGRAEQWYYVLPTVLGLAAVVAFVDALARDVRPALRRAARPVAAVALAILAAQVLLPSTVAAKHEVLHPGIEGMVEPNVLEAMRDEHLRDQDLWTAMAQMHGEDWENVFLVDVAWFFAIYPISERATYVATAYTEGSSPNLVWAGAIEAVANTTIMHRNLSPLSLAIGDVYADCITDASAQYVLLRGQDCAGRFEELKVAYEAHVQRQAQQALEARHARRR
jgi:hypothetical protein